MGEKQSMNYSLVKGFLAGIAISHFNKVFFLASIGGMMGGMWAEQNIQDIPLVKAEADKWMKVLAKTLKKD